MSQAQRSSSSAKVVMASLAGTTIEWYEFFIYGTAAALVFGKVFFPEFDPLVGTLASLSTFAIAFVARPLGGVIFGHFGDRIGRKSMLVVTLLLMGGSTFAIGLLPAYDTIGIWAPILLVTMRILQGLSLGGEYGGAVLMSVEHARADRRGLYGALVQTGAPLGSLTSTVVFLLVSRLPEEQFLSWGWRIPFLLSLVLVVIGLTIRLRLAESPEFAAAAEKGEVHRAPALVVLRSHLRGVVLTCLAYLSVGVTFYVLVVFSLSYGEVHLGLTRAEILQLTLGFTIFSLVALPAFGWLSDRVSRKGLFIAGIVGLGVMPYIWFTLLDAKQPGLMLLGYLLFVLPYAANYSALPAFYAHVFPADVRVTGLSMGYTIGTVLSGAVAPLIATWLLARTGDWMTIALYMSAMAIISGLAALGLRETYAPPSRRREPFAPNASGVVPAPDPSR